MFGTQFGDDEEVDDQYAECEVDDAGNITTMMMVIIMICNSIIITITIIVLSDAEYLLIVSYQS